jgi:hypothetical protein
MDLDTVAEELYGLPPAQFTAQRDARATEARDAGDKDLAAAIRKLRRPTTSAWLANLLVRERGDRLMELLDLGTELREAQEQLDGEMLMQLSTQRQRVVSALGHEARRIAVESGERVSDDAERELETSLEAALADPAAAEAIRSGRLTTALHYSGLGPAALSGAAPQPSPATTASPQETTRKAELEAAERAAKAAEVAATEARRALDRQAHQLRRAEAKHDDTTRQVHDMEERLGRLRTTERAAAEDLQVAQEAMDQANRDAEAAEKTASAARAKADQLRQGAD